MKTETVYDEGGELLGDEYINLSPLQKDSRLAIIQIIYLDETVDVMNAAINKATNDEGK